MQDPETPAPPPTSPRRLVLCLDGTWNSTYDEKRRDDGDTIVKPSNVLKLCRAVRPWDEADGREQIAYYDIGVGSLARYPGTANRVLSLADKLLGGGFGAGFEGNVEDALGFLALNHRPGDQVFIFGFSRGAATARALTRFLDWAGGLPVKRDAFYLPRLFRAYVLGRGQVDCGDRSCRDQVIDQINAEMSSRGKDRRLEPFQAIDVEFLGVWDTVMALGSRFRSVGTSTSPVSRSFHVDSRPARCVRHARQALAIDEARFDFRPEIWTDRLDGQSLEQRWFAGVHSNVGGGYVDDGLANLAFRWILKEAMSRRLAVDPDFVSFYRGFAQDRLYRSESLLYRTLDWFRLRRGRGRRQLVGQPPGANLSVDPSVIHRIQADPHEMVRKRDGSMALRFPDLKGKSYRPENVIAFLASQPQLEEYLTGLMEKEDKRFLPDDVCKQIAELRRKAGLAKGSCPRPPVPRLATSGSSEPP